MSWNFALARNLPTTVGDGGPPKHSTNEPSTPHEQKQGISEEETLSLYYQSREKKDSHRKALKKLAWEKDKPYACTYRYGSSNFADKEGWKRHEELHCPRRLWLCPYGDCMVKARTKGKGFFTREDRFKKHLSSAHPTYQGNVSECMKNLDPPFETQCIFRNCDYSFISWRDRIDHVAKHFKTPWKGTEWREACAGQKAIKKSKTMAEQSANSSSSDLSSSESDSDSDKESSAQGFPG